MVVINLQLLRVSYTRYPHCQLEQASIYRGKLVMKHTCGSESIPKKRVKMMRETGQAVDGVDLFIETHKSKKTNTFIDEESRVTAGRLKEVVSQNMNENGSCNLSEQEVFDEVLGPGKKERERMKGKTAGKKGKKTVTEVDVERVVEAVRRENIANMETLRRENIANIQAAIAAMIANGQLMEFTSQILFYASPLHHSFAYFPLQLLSTQVILTDGDMSTLANLKLNLDLNKLGIENETTRGTSNDIYMVKCKYLLWEFASESELQVTLNIVLAADVMYDPSCFPHLVQVLSILLKPKVSNVHKRQGYTNESCAESRGGSIATQCGHAQLFSQIGI